MTKSKIRKSANEARMKHYHKGGKSKTHHGELDFTTKKTSHVFDVGGHYIKTDRRPYHGTRHK